MNTHDYGWVPASIAGTLALLLVACGGAEPTDISASGVQGVSAIATQDSREADTVTAFNASTKPDAKLTAQTLAQAEIQAQEADPSQPLESLQPDSIASKDAYVSGAVVRKAAAAGIPAYRFYNASTGAHFYTISPSERDIVGSTISSPFSLEGAAFWVASASSPGLSPVHRFFNAQTGVHFYTISEAERVKTVATLPQFAYEGVAYYASQVAGAGLVPFYRFFVPGKGYHFYTASESEKASIQANQSDTYHYEGIGYYVLEAGSTGPLSPALNVEFVDAQGVRQSVPVISGQTTVSGVAPFLIKFDASATRATAAFNAQTAIPDPEAYAFLMTGYRLNYGENRGGVWQYPQGSSFSRDEDTGPPLFSYVYQTPGSYPVRLRTRDALGNEANIQLNVVVNTPPAPILIRPTDGRWPTLVSGNRYGLQANGDYRSFGSLDTGGRHNIVIEKVGSGADPMIATFSPDGRSKFDATQQLEYRASHIRLVNVDIGHFSEGQRGFDYVGVIGGVVRRFTEGGQANLWQEGTNIIRSNVRYARGLFFQDTELRSTAAGSGYIMIGSFNGLHARNTRFVHAENGSTTYAMLRVYGSNFTFRNNLWFSQVDGGSGNGTLISMLSLAGQTPMAWRNDDAVGPVSGTSNSQNYGYISEKQILQNNQMYASGSFLTNGISSVGSGNPDGANLVYPRLMGWEDNVFMPSGNIARTIQNGELYGQYNFWRNNRKDGGRGAFVSSSTAAPNRSVGDQTTFNGPVLSESDNSRPTPSRF